MDNIKFCVSSYSFKKYLDKTGLKQVDTVKMAKDLGFDAIEFVELNAEEGEDLLDYARRLKAECDKYGITAVNLAIGADFINGKNVPKEEEIDRVKKHIDACEILGINFLRHDALYKFGDYLSFDLALPELAAAIREVTEYAEKKGVRTMVENHGFIAQDALRVERLYNAVNHKNFSLLLDMGNFLCADENPVTSASIVAPYIAFAHAKDFFFKPGTDADPGKQFFVTRGGNFLKGAPIGHGCVPVKQILRILKKANYEGYISIEYEGYEDTLTGIEIGFENLKKYVEEV